MVDRKPRGKGKPTSATDDTVSAGSDSSISTDDTMAADPEVSISTDETLAAESEQMAATKETLVATPKRAAGSLADTRPADGAQPGELKIEARGDVQSCIDLEEPWAFSGNETTFYR